MKFLIFKTLCQIGLASSITATTIEKTAYYESLGPPNPPPITVLSPFVGVYEGLAYNAWRLSSSGGTPVKVGGVASQSPPKRIITSSIEQSVKGTPSVAVTAPYSSLALLDFYFGCVTRTNVGSASVATQCTITVAGFVKNNDQEVAVASYTFTPPVSPVASVPMMHAVLPESFKKPLVKVTMIETTPLTTAILMDNLHYHLSS